MTDDEIIRNNVQLRDSNPKYEGRFCLGGNMGLCIMIAKKPFWLKRKMMQWCFGWEWFDN